jgi:peptidoglycan/LPS O-acetylase OafA/YrhL
MTLPVDTRHATVERTPRLAFADGIRGLAALWVVLFHAAEGGHIDHLKAALPTGLARLLFDWGHLGVALFFVLSGFVMLHSVRRLPFDGALAKRFMLRRLLRLTPPYYASIAFVIVYMALKARLQHQAVALPGPDTVLSHLLYMQDMLGAPTISVVYWTLCIEIQFYLAFAVMRWAQHHADARLGAQKAALVVLALGALAGLPWAFGWSWSAAIYPGGFLSFWYAFMLGVLIAAQASGERSLRLLCAGYAVVLAVAGAVADSSFVFASLAGGAMLVAGSVLPAFERLLNQRWLQFLGVVSYSLYLTHNQITGATAFLLKRFVAAGVLAELALLAAIVAVCLVFAALAQRLVERPSIGWSRRVSLAQR